MIGHSIRYVDRTPMFPVISLAILSRVHSAGSKPAHDMIKPEMGGRMTRPAPVGYEQQVSRGDRDGQDRHGGVLIVEKL